MSHINTWYVVGNQRDDDPILRQVHRDYTVQKTLIKEGFKFFLLATKIGYIIKFTPDSRLANYKNQNEYGGNIDKWCGKIQTIVLFVNDCIIEIKKEYIERIIHRSRTVKTRKNTQNEEKENFNE